MFCQTLVTCRHLTHMIICPEQVKAARYLLEKYFTKIGNYAARFLHGCPNHYIGSTKGQSLHIHKASAYCRLYPCACPYKRMRPTNIVNYQYYFYNISFKIVVAAALMNERHLGVFKCTDKDHIGFPPVQANFME